MVNAPRGSDQENDSGSDDSDCTATEEAAPQYELISAVADRHATLEIISHPLSNGYMMPEEGGSTSDDDEEDAAAAAAAAETAMARAFTEDESRRNASLQPGDALRVREAMRGVSFPQSAIPQWAHQIPEDRWIRRPQPPNHENHP